MWNGIDKSEEGSVYLQILAGEDVSAQILAPFMDHTLLRPDAVEQEIFKLCEEAINHNFYSVCVLPFWVARIKKRFEKTDLKICSVVGFPLGANTTETKIYEIERLQEEGADELDIVINIAALKSGLFDDPQRELQQIAERIKGQTLQKIILETAYLDDGEIIRLVNWINEFENLHFIKTSTGFAHAGADLKQLQVIKKYAADGKGIKAAGGIQNYEQALAFLRAGATRIGTSKGLQIIGSKVERSDSQIPNSINGSNKY